MLFVLVSMLVILVIATVVVVYAAFPDRGEDLPGAAWLGVAMRRGVEAMPTLDETYGDRQPGAHRRG